MKRSHPSIRLDALRHCFGTVLFTLVVGTDSLTAPALATIVFNGYANALPGVGGSIVGSDWSSDFGPDFRAFPNGIGNVGGTTTATTWADGSFHNDESITLHVHREGFVDPASMEYTDATGVITIGAGGPVTPAIIHRYRIDNILYNPNNGIGIGNSGVLQGAFSFSGVSPASPLHWSATWQINIVNAGPASSVNTAQIALLRDSSDLLRINGGPLPPSQLLSGSATGSTTSSLIVFYAESSLGGGGMLGESRVTLDLQFAFSEQSLAPLGDYNENGIVDAADYVVWRKSVGQTGAGLAADGDGSGTIDSGDYDVWRANFGRPPGSGAALPSADPLSAAVPESTSAFLLILGAGVTSQSRRRIAPRMPTTR